VVQWKQQAECRKIADEQKTEHYEEIEDNVIQQMTVSKNTAKKKNHV
jgi:hypothetical protein